MSEPPLDEQASQALSMIRSNHDPALTPNLHTLRWEATHSNYVHLLPIFISGRLRSLHIPKKFGSQIWSANIPPLCPSLEIFSLAGGTRESVDLGFLDQWERLRFAICLTSLTPQALKRISTCPDLQSLALSIYDHEAWAQAIGLDHTSFPKLVATTIGCLSLDPASAWLKRLQLPKLKIIVIITHVAAPGSVACLFNILQRHPLSTISLYTADSEERHQVSISVLRLLFNCPLLTQLSINVCSFAVGDKDLEALSKAFPKLKVLDIMTHSSQEPSMITLNGLVPLLKYCPNLYTLKISINATRIRDNDDRPGNGVRNTYITKLSLHKSPIGNVERAALFLSDILPNVRTIEETSTSESWKKVATLLEVFNLARKQERRWCARRSRSTK
ncbi:hypothetical protein PAXINDRAFT_12047 [Paxillus involutus ATCC 200175]|uniref:F-box domain-containing protein n=1 Tax=Paxillus involutus ATCC 200175 TaxID=664439 RepID=A0A0C9TXY6_PAXIN|nr:hypothetical protein PAXINDRAFT_12047 [Paxillus involutus ATCC 200175]